MGRRVCAPNLRHRKRKYKLTCCPVLQRVGGKDASKQFWKYHNESILKKYKGQLHVGSLDSKKQAAAPPAPPESPPPAPKTKEKEIVKPSAESGTVAPMPGQHAEEHAEALDAYGAIIPYADPSWYQSVSQPPDSSRLRLFTDSSITHLTSMNLTLHFGKRSANGWTLR